MPSAGLPHEVTVIPHTPPPSQIQRACYKKTKTEWEAQTDMYQSSTSTFENFGCTPLDILKWWKMTEQTDWRAKQPPQVVFVPEDLEFWGAWDTTCAHKTIVTPAIAWKEDALDYFPWERAVVSHTNIGTVLKATLGKPESRGGAHSPEFQIPSGTGMNKAVKFDVGQNSHVFANYATRKGVVKRAAHSVH